MFKLSKYFDNNYCDGITGNRLTVWQRFSESFRFVTIARSVNIYQWSDFYFVSSASSSYYFTSIILSSRFDVRYWETQFFLSRKPILTVKVRRHANKNARGCCTQSTPTFGRIVPPRWRSAAVCVALSSPQIPSLLLQDDEMIIIANPISWNLNSSRVYRQNRIRYIIVILFFRRCSYNIQPMKRNFSRISTVKI